MSVHLVFLCLDAILSAYPDGTFNNIKIFTDSQIVLSWVLSKSSKIKDLFINNRLKFITSQISIIDYLSKHSLTSKFSMIQIAFYYY